MTVPPGTIEYVVPVEFRVKAQSAEHAVSVVRDCLGHGILPKHTVAPPEPGSVRKA